MPHQTNRLMVQPLLNPCSSTQFELGGVVGNYIKAVTDQWLLIAPSANPAMLEMISDRDNPPYRNLMPWAGEFAGKYLTSAVLVWRITRDPRLKRCLKKFIRYLIQLQGDDGYLGPWPQDCHLTNFSPYHGAEGLLTWDTWGHYHVMTGLLLWFKETGDNQALVCIRRMADLICQKYLGRKTSRLVDTGSTDMNLAPVHALSMLYRVTGESRYLEMALQIVDEFGALAAGVPLAGDYLKQALADKALYEMPKPRWESIHSIMSLVELYWITGEDRFRKAFEKIWWSIAEYDRHNNGGFSSGEQATGNPYDPGTIETCCTIAWIAMSIDMLKLTGNSIIADEIELTTFNSVLGMHSVTGRWSTYTTPMDGARFSSSHAIVFQSRSGSPELNCCSVNSPRGLGMIGEWAVLEGQESLVINYYGPSTIHETLTSGLDVDIHQETNYPVSGKILLQVSSSSPQAFRLRLRVPYWSKNTQIYLNHQNLDGVQPGRYYDIERVWKAGDVIEINMDMSLHFWSGEKQCQGLVSVFYGPLLLAYDQRYNSHISGLENKNKIPDDPFKVTRECLTVPTLVANQMPIKSITWKGWYPPMLLIESKTLDGQPVRLCDFASAGRTGTLYRSWLSINNAPPKANFTYLNPLCSNRPG